MKNFKIGEIIEWAGVIHFVFKIDYSDNQYFAKYYCKHTKKFQGTICYSIKIAEYEISNGTAKLYRLMGLIV